MIHKRYVEEVMCRNCDNDVCKVYGGTCKKYRKKMFFEKVKKFLKIKRA